MSKFDPKAAAQRVEQFWTLGAEFGKERNAYNRRLGDFREVIGLTLRDLDQSDFETILPNISGRPGPSGARQPSCSK